MSFTFLFLLLGLAPAQAASAPLILPDRDVAVAYQLNASQANASQPGFPEGAPEAYQLQYDAADQRARITNPAQGTYFLIDLRTGNAEMVVPELGSVVNTPDLSGLTQQITSAGHDARFTPLGEKHYAGLSCQDWLVTSAQGTATACLTPDGVALHLDGRNAHGSGSVTATAVRFAAQPPGDFTPPAGYHAITLPPGVLRALMTGGAAH